MGNWRWLALSKHLFHLTFIYIAFVGDLSIHKYATFFFYLNNKTKNATRKSTFDMSISLHA